MVGVIHIKQNKNTTLYITYFVTFLYLFATVGKQRTIDNVIFFRQYLAVGRSQLPKLKRLFVVSAAFNLHLHKLLIGFRVYIATWLVGSSCKLLYRRCTAGRRIHGFVINTSRKDRMVGISVRRIRI